MPAVLPVGPREEQPVQVMRTGRWATLAGGVVHAHQGRRLSLSWTCLCLEEGRGAARGLCLPASCHPILAELWACCTRQRHPESMGSRIGNLHSPSEEGRGLGWGGLGSKKAKAQLAVASVLCSQAPAGLGGSEVPESIPTRWFHSLLTRPHPQTGILHRCPQVGLGSPCRGRRSSVLASRPTWTHAQGVCPAWRHSQHFPDGWGVWGGQPRKKRVMLAWSWPRARCAWLPGRSAGRLH